MGLIGRPLVGVQPVVLFVAAAAGASLEGDHMIGGALVVWWTYTAAVAYNDLNDLAVDRLNSRNLPLADGAATVSDARRLITMAGVSSLVAQAWLRQPSGATVTGLAAALAIAYSHPTVAMQRRGLAGTLLLATSYVALPVSLALLQAAEPVGEMRVVSLTVLSAGFLIYKDIPDELGDRTAGKSTPVVLHGRTRAMWMAAGMGAVGAGLMASSGFPVPVVTFGVATVALMISVAASEGLRVKWALIAGMSTVLLAAFWL